MIKMLNFAILYALIFWAEFWLLARLLGNRLEGAPAVVRAALLAVIFALPAFLALAIMNAPAQDLPEHY